MLVLSRKVGERLVIDDNITVVVNRVSGNRVSLGIEAPDSVHIMRGELKEIRQMFESGSAATPALTFGEEICESSAVLPRVVH